VKRAKNPGNGDGGRSPCVVVVLMAGLEKFTEARHT
jgi:hypothetical protein